MEELWRKKYKSKIHVPRWYMYIISVINTFWTFKNTFFHTCTYINIIDISLYNLLLRLEFFFVLLLTKNT